MAAASAAAIMPVLPDRSQRRFVGERWAACPICNRPLSFGEHVVRCEHHPSHYIRVELPRPAMGEVWGLPGRPWALLDSLGHGIPRDRAGQGAVVIGAELQVAARPR